jgi:bacillithiol biosynthesis cysteine-adding enzyme BshC
MKILKIPYDRLARRYPPFFVSWVAGAPSSREFLPPVPSQIDAMRSLAEIRGAQPLPRQAVADAFARRHRALGSPPAVLDGIESLRAPGTCCVMAGQQPMLVGGPTFIALKALSVLAAARRIESRLGIRCVPLLWNHSDDHDVPEIDALTLAADGDRLAVLRAGLAATRRPIRDVTDADRLARFLREVVAALPPTPFRPILAAHLEGTFDPRPAGWFSRLLTRWFGDEGLVVFEPHWIASLAAPLLARALAAPDLVGDALESGGQALDRAGFRPPLPPVAPGLFVLRDGARSRLEPARGGAGYAATGDGTIESTDRWLDRLRAEPERFSPGVALRPVVQDAIFPTIAFVAGPNEAAYLAQLGPLYERLGVFRPPIAPRMGATIVAPEVADAARACHASYEAVLRGEAIAPPLPSPLAPPIEAARRDLEAVLERLGRETAAGPRSERAFRKTRARILESVDLYARRLAESAPPRDEAARAVRRLRLHLTPEEALQERTIAGVYWLDRFGPDFFRRLGQAIDPEAPAHHVIEVEG